MQKPQKGARVVPSLPVDQAEVLLADGDPLGADADGQPLAVSIAGPVPLHPVMLQGGDQLQGLVFHRPLAQSRQSLVSRYDAAGRDATFSPYSAAIYT